MEFRLEKRSYLIGRSSHCITLPFDWCKFYGERINKVTIFGNGVLIVAPQGLEHDAEKLIQRMKNAKKTREWIQSMKNTDKEVHHD